MRTEPLSLLRLGAVILRGAAASADCCSRPARGCCDCSNGADWWLCSAPEPLVRGLRCVAFPQSGTHTLSSEHSSQGLAATTAFARVPGAVRVSATARWASESAPPPARRSRSDEDQAGPAPATTGHRRPTRLRAAELQRFLAH